MSIYGNTTKFPMTPFVFDNIYTDNADDQNKEQYEQMLTDVSKGVYLANRYLLYKVIDEDEVTGEIKYLYGQVFRVVADEAGPQIELVATLNAPSFTVGELNFASEGLNPERRISGDNAENKVDIILPEDGDHLTFQLNFTLQSIGKMCSDIWDMLLGTDRNGYLSDWDDHYFNNLGGAIGALYNLMGKEQIIKIGEGEDYIDFPPEVESFEDYIYYIANDGFVGGTDYYENAIEVNQYYYWVKVSKPGEELDYKPVKLEGFAEGMQNLYKDLVNIKQLMGFFDPNVVNTETVQGCINTIRQLIEDPNIKLLSLQAINVTADEVLNEASINTITDDETYIVKLKGSSSVQVQANNNKIILSGVGKNNGVGESFGVDTKTLNFVPNGQLSSRAIIALEPVDESNNIYKATFIENQCFVGPIKVEESIVFYKWSLYQGENQIGTIQLISDIEESSIIFYGKIGLQGWGSSIDPSLRYTIITDGEQLFIRETSVINTEGGLREELILGTNSAEGYNTIATNVTGQKIIGKYNDYTKPNVLFAVGNGTSDDDRSNAFTVYKDGSIEIGNELQNVILEETINSPENATEGISYSFIQKSAIAKISGKQFTVYGYIGAQESFGQTITTIAPDWTKLLETIKKTKDVQIENIYNICLTPSSDNIQTIGRRGNKIWINHNGIINSFFYFTIEGYVSTWGNPISTTEEE